MPHSDKSPQDEMHEGFLPGKGLNRMFFRSELPKVLLVIAAALLLKAFFFADGETSENSADAWLAAPVAATDERTFKEAFAVAVTAAPQGFREGMEEKVRFLAYAGLRAESERTGRPVPVAALSPASLFSLGCTTAYRLSAAAQPFTLMRIVSEEDTLRKAHPGWHKDFLALPRPGR